MPVPQHMGVGTTVDTLEEIRSVIFKLEGVNLNLSRDNNQLKIVATFLKSGNKSQFGYLLSCAI